MSLRGWSISHGMTRNSTEGIRCFSVGFGGWRIKEINTTDKHGMARKGIRWGSVLFDGRVLFRWEMVFCGINGG